MNCSHDADTYRKCVDCGYAKCNRCTTKCYHCSNIICMIHMNACVCKNEPVCQACLGIFCKGCNKQLCPKDIKYDNLYKLNDDYYCEDCCENCAHCDQKRSIDELVDCKYKKSCKKKVCPECNIQFICIDGCVNICTKEGTTEEYDSHDGEYDYFPTIYKIPYKNDDGSVVTKIVCENCTCYNYNCEVCKKKEKTINGVCPECTVKCGKCDKYIRRYYNMHKCKVCEKTLCITCYDYNNYGVCKDDHKDLFKKCELCNKQTLEINTCSEGHTGCDNCISYYRFSKTYDCKKCKRLQNPRCKYKIHYDDYTKQDNFIYENGYYQCTLLTESKNNIFCKTHSDFLYIK